MLQTPSKIVILSEAPHASIAYPRVYGAQSKDLGDACWQMPLRAFRPQTIRKIKKVTSPRNDKKERVVVKRRPLLKEKTVAKGEGSC